MQDFPRLETTRSLVRLEEKPIEEKGRDLAKGAKEEELLDRLRALPEELLTMTEVFVESLSEPIHRNPLGPEAVAALYQNFYTTSAERMHLLLPHDGDGHPKAETQMLTFDEIATRKRKRELNLLQLQVWEDVVERLATEAVYDRIFSIKTSNDALRDSNLQEKMSFLKERPTTLHQLGVTNLNEEALKEAFKVAGCLLKSLVDCQCPKDKLDRIIAAHKSLVDGLSSNVPESSAQSSGADLILPCLIYTIIIYQPTCLVSNLTYIQRFRANQAIHGEAAYCLVNMEAAISFLETINVTSLGTTAGDQLILDINASIPLGEDEGQSRTAPSRLDQASTLPRRAVNFLSKPSDLAASAVNTADQSIRSLSATLEGSYKFFFKRFEQRQDVAPKTLEDVRRLVGVTQHATGAQSSLLEHSEKLSLPAENGKFAGMNIVRGYSPFGKAAPVARTTSASSVPIHLSENQQLTTKEEDGPSINETFFNMSFEEFKVCHIRELLEEYKILASFVKSHS